MANQTQAAKTALQFPLTVEEMIDILTTINAMEEEIHHPGAAAHRGHDLLDDIKDAQRRLIHSIGPGG
jgi:hypothetical protein